MCSYLLERRAKNQYVIAIAHTKMDRDELTESIVGNPSLPGQVPAYVMSLFPEMIYLRDQNGVHTAHFIRNGLWPAATRRLDIKSCVNPNLTTLYWRQTEKPK